MPEKHICQSCSMPMQKPEDFGSNEDGSRNAEYCTFCFRDGKFTFQGTLEQMTEKLVSMSAQMGMTEEAARAIAKKILPTLKRWKN